jgi:hypothetical protein
MNILIHQSCLLMNQENSTNTKMRNKLKNTSINDDKNFYLGIILHWDTSSQQFIKPTFQLPFNSLNGSVLNDGCVNTTVL